MNVLQYARQLIAFDTTSPRTNAEISDFIEQTFRRLGFATERVTYEDAAGVQKVNVLGRKGSGGGGLAYFGHTDVVPADTWFRDEPGAFDPVVDDGRLYGRGSTDMKGSVACMLAAAERLADETWHRPLYISCTADEEVDHRGANEVVQRSQMYRELVSGGAWGVVGEATQMRVVYAHKGGCRFTVTGRGRASHSSTTEGVNANLAMIPFLAEMKAIHDETQQQPQWQNDEFDPPTVCWNIGINDHTRTTNITPPQSICTVAFRPMPGTDTESLLERVRRFAAGQQLEFQLDTLHPPFRTDPKSDFVQLAVRLTGGTPPHTVGYGSEASNFKEVANLILLGPGDIAQAHTHDEWIEIEQLQHGTAIYEKLIRHRCLQPA